MADIRNVPVVEIVNQLESHVSHKEFDQAAEYITGKINEYKDTPDHMGFLALLNEAMLFYTEIKKADEALEYADKAISIINNPMLDTRAAEATISLNAAKIYRLCGQKDKALFLYIRSVDHYEKEFEPNDPRLANMYNNIALNISALHEISAAMDLYDKAIDILSKRDDSAPELALTHLNVAFVLYKTDKEAHKEEIDKRIAIAKELIDSSITEDSYYARVCEQCANSFALVGRADYQRELLNRAKLINIKAKKSKK